MEETVIKAEKRESLKKGFLKKQRREGKVPGTFYKKDSEPNSFICEDKDIKNIEHFRTSILTMQINGKKHKGLIRDIQYHPVTDSIIHFDLMGVDLKKNVVLEVPTVLRGTPIGVKISGGILEHITHKIEIECLPTDIPEYIEIDVSELNIGDSVHIEDVKIEKVRILSK